MQTGTPAELDIGGGALWGELFDTLSSAEQTCIRNELGAELLKSVQEQPVTPGERAQGWEASVFACLAPENAMELFLAFMLANMEELTENEDCLRDLVADIDVVGLMAASMPDADPASAGMLLGFSTSLLACIPIEPLPGIGGARGPCAIGRIAAVASPHRWLGRHRAHSGRRRRVRRLGRQPRIR